MPPPTESDRPIPVIVNPGARGARAGLRMEDIRALSPRVRLVETTGAGDARRIARELALAGEPIVVAAGGDGTVNEAVNGIAEAGAAAGTALGVLPTGTMNVFAAELGVPSGSLAQCWRIIAAGQVRDIDLWRVNDTHFIQLAGAGLDAAIIRETTWERKKKFGPASYVFSGLKLLTRPAQDLVVTAPGREPVRGPVVLVGNGRHYGGPFRVFPAASMTDGLLDVMVMRHHSVLSFLALTRALISGTYRPGPEVTYFQTESLTVEAPEPIPCEADGELVGTAASVTFARAGTMRVIGL